MVSLTPAQRRRAAFIAALGAPLVSVLGRTLRWRVDGYRHYEQIIASGRQPIFSFWHGRILPGLLFWKHHGIVVITSENFDGEWIARIINRFGYGTARGSSSRGGMRALVQLRREMADGRPVAFTLDGPRGPAHAAQPGAVWLAGATGNPLLPFHLESSRAWTARSWDRTQVPKPFSRVGLAIGAPIEVADTQDATIDARRRELEIVLGHLERRALDLAR
ncbi:MAG TPA: lysophospholipid acyltransferase family protein [Vicinamibacterales bacterium]|nr:lysophospholipid acyltransferase family protein [Vicinamibacterales bacterium]